MKTTTQTSSPFLGKLIAMVPLPTWPNTQHECLHQESKGGCAAFDREGRLLDGPQFYNRTLWYATQARVFRVVCQKICATTSPIICGHLTNQIVIFLIIMYGYGSVNHPHNQKKTQCDTNDELKKKRNGIIYQFKQGDLRKSLYEIPEIT